MITLEHVAMRFGGLTAVDDVSLAIPAGRITGLIGPNGAGKTTLFNIVAGHVLPTSGRVLLDNEDITRLKPHQRCGRGLARTFQIPHEFGRLTVLENLMASAAAPLGQNVFNAGISLARRRRPTRARRTPSRCSNSGASAMRRPATFRAGRRSFSNWDGR